MTSMKKVILSGGKFMGWQKDLEKSPGLRLSPFSRCLAETCVLEISAPTKSRSPLFRSVGEFTTT
jgi:hypothetical protein